MDTGCTRRSDRVSLAVPIRVTGTDVNGEVFSEEGKTIVVSRHGATICLDRMLAPQQEIVIRYLGTGEEAEFRVVGEIAGGSKSHVYGVALVDPATELWRITFPPLTESEKAAARALLQCGGCGERQIVYLDELEAEVFGVNRSISRSCKRCRETTLWMEAQHEAVSKPNRLPKAARKAQPTSSPARTQN